LLRTRDEETVGDWIDRYRRQGTAGLGVRPGRGRKPAFSPSAPHGPGGQG
jgi:transposase